MGLRVNTLKTEIFVQTIHPPETPHLFLVNGEPVKTVEHFTYLGSVVHSDCSVDLDIQRRINLASSAFGRLRDRVFSNNNLTIDTKAAVYKAVCISTLLYGSETWTTYRRHIRTLENFHTRCPQRILGISWKDRMTYDELYHRTQTSSIETLLAQRHLRWVGHTIRMPENRLPRQMLCGQLSSGSRSVGGPKKRYKDHCKDLLIKCNVNPNELETLAVDRQTWRTPKQLLVKNTFATNVIKCVAPALDSTATYDGMNDRVIKISSSSQTPHLHKRMQNSVVIGNDGQP
ncbi:uncharacterized protein LOC143022573 [Oratosquilla oratoria]|uniref:uncharacterized protein LOC143022573 n=1 Tax=Oratosquilla oratoria TaxID=337810 RepID=UPI003F7596FE